MARAARHGPAAPGMGVEMRCKAAVSTVLGALALGALLPSGAAAVDPPGPPPGAGASLPASPGTAPAFVPAGTPATLPGASLRPGLLSSAPVRFDRTKRAFALPLACQANGSVSAIAAKVGALGRAPYRCAGNRATARITVTRKIAGRLAKAKTVAATAVVRQGGTSRLSFNLVVGASSVPPAGFWTDGHLQCTTNGAPQAFLAEPDFTTVQPTTVSTRGWIALFTPASGWHWYGDLGENAARWDTWTATPGGIAQFHLDGATTPAPWTWGPIAIPTGQGILAIGVYEIVYWVGGQPQYRWEYVNAGTTGAVAAGAATPFCVYP
jgi:hypothetical protein